MKHPKFYFQSFNNFILLFQIPKSMKIGREDGSSDGPLAKKHAGSKLDKKKISKDKKKTLKRL